MNKKLAESVHKWEQPARGERAKEEKKRAIV